MGASSHKNTQKRITNYSSRPTYLPAAISVSQKAKEDAEYHVAKKHHLEMEWEKIIL